MNDETNVLSGGSLTCSICSVGMEEPYVQGVFGILPVSFCDTCFGCMLDMAEEYNEVFSDE